MIFLQDHYPEKVVAGFPLKAILLPRVTGGTATTLKMTSAGTVLGALAPSTLVQLPGSNQDALRAMTNLVRQLPCYVLEVGTDISKIPKTISNLLLES